ncbi:MAG: ATP-binding cassette domain-containing protein [Sphingobacteriia bacterium]|nr:ATP-binding cassette domain-containing protein [Sphingobacteriia bacterium]
MVDIVIKNLSKAFGEKVVLDNINLEIPKGESLVIIGGSGTGKSVFIKNLIGLIHPDSGKVFYDNVDFYKADKDKRREIMGKIGVLFQGGALFDSFKVWENVSFVLRQNQNMPAKQAKEIAIEKLSLVGLQPEVADLYPVELSGGMQKRVALARAIAAKPEIIFFDEPTSGLDPINTNVIADLIIKCTKELGITAITITHDMVSAKHIATNLCMLYKGKMVFCGDKQEIERTDNPYLHQFMNGLTSGPIQIETSLSSL